MTLSFVFDPAQTMYTWRNASHDLSLFYDKLFPNVKTYTILKNYRTPKQLVELANEFRKFFCEHGIEYTPSEPHLPKMDNVLSIREFETCNEEIKCISKEIRELHKLQGVAYSKISVLCRTNKMLTDLESGLVAQGIPYYLKYDSWSVMRQSPFRFLYSLYSLFINPTDIFSFCEILKSLKGIGDKFLEKLRSTYSRHTPVLKHVFAEKSKQDLMLQKMLKQFVLPLNEMYLKGCSFSVLNKSIASAMDNLFNFEESKVPISKDKMDMGVERGQFSKAFTTLHNVYSIASEDTSFTSLSYLDQFQEIYDSLQLSQDVYGKEKTGKEDEKISEEAVGLHTIHSFKGKENDFIYYAMVNPLSKIDYYDFESKCVFYVAITRPKRKLSISGSDLMLNYENRLVRSFPNPFLEKLKEIIHEYRKDGRG